MKKLILLILVVPTLTSCGMMGFKNKPETTIKKTFFNGMIVYNFESREAWTEIRKVENLQTQKLSPEEKTLSEKTMVRIYRDADVDRDRLITLEEAQMMRIQHTFNFEDSLGRLE